MTYPVVIYGSPVLRKVCREISKDFEGLNEFVNNMFETMYKADGVGLAAPQVGKSIRLFVIDGAPMAEDDPSLHDFKKVFINAKITHREGEDVLFNEGCLSIPNIREDVLRPPKIHIEYYDENFNFHSEHYDGVRARIIQHEYDHTEGILFVDKISPLRRRLITGKLNALAKGKVNDVAYKVKAAR